MRIALAGNPNAGKSTLFNALSGSFAPTGNYAGVTVERREAQLAWAAGPQGPRRRGGWGFRAANAPAQDHAPSVTVVDLPGCYSLTARSADEDVAQRVLLGDLGEAPCDFVVCVVDSLQLARGFYLVLQLRELGVPAMVVLTMADVARARGLSVDAGQLAARLGLPVVRCAARQGEGVAAVQEALRHAADDHLARRPTADEGSGDAGGPARAEGTHGVGRAAPPELAAAVVAPAAANSDGTQTDLADGAAAEALPACPLQLTEQERAHLQPLVDALAEADHPRAPQPLGLALWLVTSRLETLRLRLPDAVRRALVVAQAALNPQGDGAFNRRTINARFATVDRLVREVRHAELPPHPRTRALDDVLLHPVWGGLAFVAAMFVLFQAVFAWAAPVMEAVGAGVGALAEAVGGWLPAGAFSSLVTEGVLVGVGNVLTFVPQVGLLFVGLGVLEESGYMARAACLLDRPMRRVGLSGRAFIPLMSSFACAIPGILATRTMDARDGRLRTMLVAPLMSCSARLPVYTLVVAAVFAHVPPLGGVVQVGGLLILAMYLLGFLAALGTAWLLRRTAVPGPVPHMLLELPDYRLPRPGVVLRRASRQAFRFVVGSGGTIVALSVLLWATLHFPRPTPPPVEALWTARAAAQSAPAATGPSVAEGEALQRAWQLERSAAGSLGRAIEPLLRPLGFDWRIGVGLLASFAAREVLVSTLAQIYAADAEASAPPPEPARMAAAEAIGGVTLPTVRATSLSETLRAQRDASGQRTFTPLVGVSLMVFFVLALQCSSTVAVLRRETGGWGWPLAAVAYMNGLAWVASFVVYQGGRALGLG